MEAVNGRGNDGGGLQLETVRETFIRQRDGGTSLRIYAHHEVKGFTCKSFPSTPNRPFMSYLVAFHWKMSLIYMKMNLKVEDIFI